MSEILEQPSINNGSKEFGKFNSAESLLKAYNSLEAEFTKKSQKLASLENETQKTQNELNKQAEQDKKIEELVSKFGFIKPFTSALKESLNQGEDVDLNEVALRLISSTYKTAEDYSRDDEFLNNYIFSSQEIKDKIVKDYLSKITQNSPIKVENGSSSISLTPPKVPKTISEAGNLAKSIIKQK